jgi:hypothetical protein
MSLLRDLAILAEVAKCQQGSFSVLAETFQAVPKVSFVRILPDLVDQDYRCGNRLGQWLQS